MNDARERSGRQCFFCGVSLHPRPGRIKKKRQSYQLTNEFVRQYPYLIDYSRHQFWDRRHITEEDSICKTCLQRAGRFFILTQLARDLEEETAESRRMAIDETFEPSNSTSVVSSTSSSMIDPLEGLQIDPLEYMLPILELAIDPLALDNMPPDPELAIDPLDMPPDPELAIDAIDNMPPDPELAIDAIDNMPPDPEVPIDPLLGLQEDVQDVADGIMPQVNPEVPVFPVPGFSRLPHISNEFIVRGCRHNNLTRIPITIRRSVLLAQNLYITRGSRVCQEHLGNVLWHDLEDFPRPKIETFNSPQISDMLRLLQKNSSDRLDFERLNYIDDRVFYFYIGFTKEVFLTILEETPSISRNLKKKPKTALATVLCKLHTDDSNERLSSLFRMTPQYISAVMRKTRRCLITEFVPKHLGLDHLYSDGNGEVYRRELYERILRVPNVLYGSLGARNIRLITIADGTYFYIQKSTNYAFQRKTYSLHKYRNLIKVFLIVCPDGYIIDAYGPYPANMSDAEILSDLIREPEGNDEIDNPFHWFFQKDDVFILDRGFRDVIEEVEEKGYQAYMPKTKDENDRQLSTEQANDSRKVTLCRWVVETINGRLKNQFRQLRNKNSNLSVPHMYEEVRIACALINAFGARLVDNGLVDEFINQIYLKHDSPNRLSNLITENNFNQRRAYFRPIDAIQGFEQFPELTHDDLIIMSLGPYQVQQGRSYYAEHVKENGAYTIEVYEDRQIDANLVEYNILTTEPWLVRAKIQSRHHNRRIYFSYILVEDSLDGRNKIVEYYCNCLVGKRTLGCCAHVMSIMWYLGWARHQDPLPEPPAAFLDDLFDFTDDED